MHRQCIAGFGSSVVVVPNGRPELEESSLMVDEAFLEKALALSDPPEGVEQAASSVGVKYQHRARTPTRKCKLV